MAWKSIALLGILFAATCCLHAGAVPTGSAHTRDFWRKIAKNHYAVPAGQPVFPLMRELSGYLGSTDPELRDDLAYSILATWIARQKDLSAAELIALVNDWRANLRSGIGERGSDSVFKRSFSALCLASLAERDLTSPFLGEQPYRALLADALAYLGNEADLRAFDPAKGWIHATAHTADLLTALASNLLLRAEDQARVLRAVGTRLNSAGEIFGYGEQDRLAAVVAAIVRRKDSDRNGFARWLSELDAADQQVWQQSPPNLTLLKTFENDSYMLRALAASLAAEPAGTPAGEAQRIVLQVLKRR